MKTNVGGFDKWARVVVGAVLIGWALTGGPLWAWIGLVPLVEGDSLLMNYIAVIAVNPERFPNVNAKGATAFMDWLTGDEAQALIRDFGKDTFGEPLFFPNAKH